MDEDSFFERVTAAAEGLAIETLPEGVITEWGSSSNRVKIYSKPPPKRPLGVIFRHRLHTFNCHRSEITPRRDMVFEAANSSAEGAGGRTETTHLSHWG